MAGDARPVNLPRNSYGSFVDGGKEYAIHDPRTPRPWINLIANERVGLTVSQTGSGFSWIDNSQLGAIVRWQQEFAEDRSGRFLYLSDAETGEVWSLAPAPCWPAYSSFVCRHGLGYTTFETVFDDIAAEWTLFVDPVETVEIWQVRLVNRGDRRRELRLTAYLEWNCGSSPAPRREFQKLFLETLYEPTESVIFAGSHMWDIASSRWGHWNTSFPYWTAFAAAQPVAGATGDKLEFLGRNGDWRQPAWLEGDARRSRFGRHYDPVGALLCPVTLEPGGAFDGGFLLTTSASREESGALVRRFRAPEARRSALENARAAWAQRLEQHRIATPESSLDLLVNDWLRYQAIGARLWGRAGYYQQSGAYGFRDQLQDSQVWLTIEPERCRNQILLHAGHQFADGSVYHWWHPISEAGHVTRMSDDLLWLAFVTANYLKETGDFAILEAECPYLDEPRPRPLIDHIRRAFARVEQRTSARGLPFIGGGDWNDGLSAVGLLERGESVWLGQFLCGLFDDWREIATRLGEQEEALTYASRRQHLVDAIERHAWDGEWYRRATRDDGTWLGGRESATGRIYLNSQTWAILNDVGCEERLSRCFEALKEHLISEAGALLLAPAYSTPDETIGYITRYAPGLRENGGVYTHAAVWAIAAAAKRKDPATVGRLLAAINPSNKDPDEYWAEPYVLPGNVDGPDSPLHGRAGWTWYTGSAAWLSRVVSERVLGVRPTWDGLLIDPCLPPGWSRARMHRPYRGATVDIEIEAQEGQTSGPWQVAIGGTIVPDGRLNSVTAGTHYRVRVSPARR
jgi:cellobiose phosphorylase